MKERQKSIVADNNTTPKFLEEIRYFWNSARVLIIAAISIVIITIIATFIYENFKDAKIVQAEIVYQNCLDKVIAERPDLIQRWGAHGRPDYNPISGNWELGLMQWVLANYHDICSEYNTTLISWFVEERLSDTGF